MNSPGHVICYPCIQGGWMVFHQILYIDVTLGLLDILTLFQTKTCHFPLSISYVASTICIHFQTWALEILLCLEFYILNFTLFGIQCNFSAVWHRYSSQIYNPLFFLNHSFEDEKTTQFLCPLGSFRILPDLSKPITILILLILGYNCFSPAPSLD